MMPPAHHSTRGLPAEHFARSAASSAMSGFALGDVLRTFWRRRFWFLATFIIFVSAVAIATIMIPKTYSTETKLITGRSGTSLGTEANTNVPLLNAMLQSGGFASPESYVALIKQQPLATRVIEELNLKTTPGRLLAGVTVKPITNTSILSLSVAWSDPKTSADIGNALGRAFVDAERELVAKQVGTAVEYLDERLPSARANMQAAEQRLQKFQSENRIADITGQTQAAVARLGVLQGRLSDAEADRDQATAQLAVVQGSLAGTPQQSVGSRTISDNPVGAQLRTRLAQVSVELETARKQYTDEHPTVLRLSEEKQQIQRQLGSLPGSIQSSNNVVPNPLYQLLQQQKEALEGRIAASAATISALRTEQTSALPLLQSMPKAALQYAELARDAKSAEDFYSALKRKHDDAAIARDAALSDVAVAVPASASAASVAPNLTQNLTLAIVAGIILGLGTVFIIELLDQTIRDEETVESTLHVPTLTAIPELRESDETWRKSMWSQSFVQLTSGLRYSTLKPLRTLSITSPSTGEGKSLIAKSAAIALAAVKPKILLVDADLHRSSMDAQLGVPAADGLSEVLVGLRHIDDVIQTTKHPGLDYLSSGMRPPNPTKLLESEQFAALIADLCLRYELVVFDTPALAASFDGTLISSQVDGTVMVLSAGSTPRGIARRCLDRLLSVPSVNFLGVVLNRAETSGLLRQVFKDYADGLSAADALRWSARERRTKSALSGGRTK
jgi:succinoglycan biosynthesis transport protein ExoP